MPSAGRGAVVTPLIYIDTNTGQTRLLISSSSSNPSTPREAGFISCSGPSEVKSTMIRPRRRRVSSIMKSQAQAREALGLLLLRVLVLLLTRPVTVHVTRCRGKPSPPPVTVQLHVHRCVLLSCLPLHLTESEKRAGLTGSMRSDGGVPPPAASPTFLHLLLCPLSSLQGQTCGSFPLRQMCSPTW
ncbi:hypothetical protein EYF80_031858 [Liparis tanakae]|uniref:Uncharacterized protein n=1 Tax=Liparis tanakae TaxID=230148 RepID=A0A4Z2GZ59_9TELE|nr:hypothetical protein EYF80_031858 [Liparis tanakae]